MRHKGCSKRNIVLGILFIMGIVSTIYFFKKSYLPKASNNPVTISQNVLDLAEKLYQEKKAQGLSFSDGPCLSNNIFPDWVVDIAHNPRQPIDDITENQCSAFREGKAHHFIELDPNGNLIRMM